MRSFKLPLILIFAVLFAATAFAADVYNIDPNHSSATFTVRHMVISNVPGRFGSVTGTINYDEKDITKSSVEAVIKTATISTM